MHHHHLHTVILYHAKCPDGFGSAYAAWKKFGDTVEYIPVKHGDPIPEKMEGREIILVDFCYPKEDMEELRRIAESVTVLDHHEGMRAVATSFPGVFDVNRSGATISWTYFHPDTPTPRLFRYLEDNDLYRFALTETFDILSYIRVMPYTFDAWDTLSKILDNDEQRETFLIKASTYTEYFKLLADISVKNAKKVRFEGYEVAFANTHQVMKSYVGNQLVKEFPPFVLIVSAHPSGFGVSIRGNGTVDVSKIAAKYGGSGHPKSSGFFIKADSKLPWEEIVD